MDVKGGFMHNFHEYLYKYGLHDCRLDDILFENGNIVFCFHSGVYRLNSVGKEIERTAACRMTVEFNEKCPLEICDHIEINQILHRKIKEINCHEFIENVKKFKFDIDINYYSYFCNTVLLKGYINNGKYEIVISEVKKVGFTFVE